MIESGLELIRLRFKKKCILISVNTKYFIIPTVVERSKSSTYIVDEEGRRFEPPRRLI